MIRGRTLCAQTKTLQAGFRCGRRPFASGWLSESPISCLLPQVGIGPVHYLHAQVSIPDYQEHIEAPGQGDKGIVTVVVEYGYREEAITARLTRAANREIIRLKSSLVERPNAKMKPPNPSAIPPV